MNQRFRDRANAGFAELPEKEYLAIRELLKESAGIVYDEKRREVLRLHLRDRARAAGCGSFADYVALVTADATELQALWNQVAIHQTEFFRNRPQFDGFRTAVLPEVLRVAREKGKILTVWSAGCSSGEEPYSLAIALAEALGSEASAWKLRVVATDISTEILARAATGTYDARRVEGIPLDSLDRWFSREDGAFVVAPEIRNIVEFASHNLATDPAPPPVIGRADIVFCCNVTIYFSKDALHRAIDTLEGALRPGGYLFLGHSESLWRQPHHLELVDLGNSFTYRKPYIAADLSMGPVLPAATVRTITEATEVPAEPPGVSEAPAQIAEPATEEPAATAQVPEPLESDTGEGFASGQAEIADVEAFDAPIEHSELAEIVATAQGQLERGEVDDAVLLVKAALKRAPTDAPLHFLLGSAQQRLGDYAAALTSLGRAIYCDHTFSLAYFYKALILEDTGSESQALAEFRNALRWLEADHDGKWDSYLEAMSHSGLISLCRSKIDSAPLTPKGNR